MGRVPGKKSNQEANTETYLKPLMRGGDCQEVKFLLRKHKGARWQVCDSCDSWQSSIVVPYLLCVTTFGATAAAGM